MKNVVSTAAMLVLLSAIFLLGALEGQREARAPGTWTPGQVGVVYAECGAAGFTRSQCDCWVREYERASPDPHARGRQEESDAALRACHITLPSSEVM